MRRSTIATLLATSALAAVLLVAPRGALAQAIPAQATPAQADQDQVAPVRAIPVPATPAQMAPMPEGGPALKIDPSQLPAPVRAALGQTGAAAKAPGETAGQTATPSLSVDLSTLPALPPIVPAAQREQMALVATGAGAAVGVLLVDIVTGGLLLAPLGVPSAVSLVGFGGAAVAAPTYSVAQRMLAAVASVATAFGGGYIGRYLASSRPDLIGLQE
jgi:xanthosine utilization system XapX-like protein